MSDLSHSKAMNARDDFKELDGTGANMHARKMHQRYCAEPTHTTANALLAALDGLRPQERIYLKQALRI